MFQRPLSPSVPTPRYRNWVRPMLMGLIIVVALVLGGHSQAAMEPRGQPGASRNDVLEPTVANVQGRNDHHCRHDEHRLSSGWGLAQGKQHETQGDGGPAIGMAAPCPRSIKAISGKPSPPARSALLPVYLLTQRLRP